MGPRCRAHAEGTQAGPQGKADLRRLLLSPQRALRSGPRIAVLDVSPGHAHGARSPAPAGAASAPGRRLTSGTEPAIQARRAKGDRLKADGTPDAGFLRASA